MYTIAARGLFFGYLNQRRITLQKDLRGFLFYRRRRIGAKIFRQRQKFQFLEEIFRFLTNISTFDRNFHFWQKVWFLKKSSTDFHRNFDCWRKFQFLTKSLIFSQKLTLNAIVCKSSVNLSKRASWRIGRFPGLRSQGYPNSYFSSILDFWPNLEDIFPTILEYILSFSFP